MNKRLLLCLVVLTFSMVFPVQAQSVVSLFDIEPGVRCLGMGGACVALGDDETTTFTNPAGLAYLRAMAFEFNAENRFGRSTYGGVTLTGRNLGLGGLFLSISDIVGRNENGDVTRNFDYTSLGTYFSAGATLQDLSLTFLNTPPLDNIAMGIRAHLYRVDFMGNTGSTVGLTLSPSGLFKLPLGGNDLRIGAIVENLLPIGITYGTGHSEPWRIGARLGVAMDVIDDLTLAAEFETSGIFHLGGEYRISGLNTPEISGLAIRAGSIFVNGGPMFTVGLGAKIATYEVNYAFTGHPYMPASHRLSFTARFANQTLMCLFTGFDEVGICDP